MWLGFDLMGLLVVCVLYEVLQFVDDLCDFWLVQLIVVDFVVLMVLVIVDGYCYGLLMMVGVFCVLILIGILLLRFVFDNVLFGVFVVLLKVVFGIWCVVLFVGDMMGFWWMWIILWFLVVMVVVVLIVWVFVCCVVKLIGLFVVVVEWFGCDFCVLLLLVCGFFEIVDVVNVFNVMQGWFNCYVEDCMMLIVVVVYDLWMLLMWLLLWFEKVFDGFCFVSEDDIQEMSNWIGVVMVFVCDMICYVSCQWFDLWLLVESIIDDFGDCGVQVMFVLGVLLMMEGDVLVLKVFFVNLVDNVIKYVGSVEICLFCVNDMVVIEVVDDGFGFDQGDLDQVFELFFCVECLCSCDIGGSGLGFVSVCVVVCVYGGDVRFEN